MDPTGLEERSAALLRELRHLQDSIQALLKGPRSDVRADQDMVTGRQGHALYLIRDGAPTMGQLAIDLGISPAAATPVADQLVAFGLAERLRDPADRRVVRITATERGRTLIRDRNVWEARALTALASALREVEPGEGRKVVANLLRLVESALEHVEDGGSPEGTRDSADGDHRDDAAIAKTTPLA